MIEFIGYILVGALVSVISVILGFREGWKRASNRDSARDAEAHDRLDEVEKRQALLEPHVQAIFQVLDDMKKAREREQDSLMRQARQEVGRMMGVKVDDESPTPAPSSPRASRGRV